MPHDSLPEIGRRHTPASGFGRRATLRRDGPRYTANHGYPDAAGVRAGAGVLAGARLYATVFAVGLLLRFNWFTLPAAWQHASVLADTRVLIAAGIACAIEFVADKIPWVDSAWDSIHTFIRPIGAALLTSSLFSNLEPAYKVVLFLLAGGVALSGHSAKAAARLAVNHSPEPFSNLALSLGEDALTAGGLYLLVKHPWAMAAIALCFLGLFAWLAPRMYRALRAEGRALAAVLRNWAGNPREPRLTPAQERSLAPYSAVRLHTGCSMSLQPVT